MRAITIRQPWAWAVVHGGKDVENRTRNIAGKYRGLVAIHAGLYQPGRIGQRTMFDEDLEVERDKGGLLLRSERLAWPYRLPLGVIVGVGNIVEVHHSDECYDRDLRHLAFLYANDREAFNSRPDVGGGGLIGRAQMCSPWAMDDHWHLIFDDMRPLTRPIPWRGALGLWTLPDEALAGAL